MGVLEEILEVQAWESPEHYIRILKMLLSENDDHIATLDALRYEARTNDDILKDPQKFEEEKDRFSIPAWWLLYDEKATRAYAALYWQKFFAYASLPYVERQQKTHPLYDMPVILQDWAAKLHNPKGIEIVSSVLPNFISAVEIEELRRARIRVLIVLCASRLYMWDNQGKVPNSIDDLIPKYLSVAPVDPFGSGAITLKDGVVSSKMHDQKEQIDQYRMQRTGDIGGYLYRKIEVINPPAVPPLQPKGDKKKRRRRRKR